jgi:hypothetical protein
MIRLNVGNTRVGISFESMVWFAVFTAAGTVLGAMVYQGLVPYLPEWITGIPPTATTATPTPTIPGLTGNN